MIICKVCSRATIGGYPFVFHGKRDVIGKQAARIPGWDNSCQRSNGGRRNREGRIGRGMPVELSQSNVSTGFWRLVHGCGNPVGFAQQLLSKDPTHLGAAAD